MNWIIYLVAGLGLIWNLMGCGNFLMQMNSEALAGYPESHRALIEARPVWATLAVAISVFGGALGCLLLLFKKPVAVLFLAVSLVGTLVQLAPTLPLLGDVVDFSAGEIALAVIGPLVVSLFLLFYARRYFTVPPEKF